MEQPKDKNQYSWDDKPADSSNKDLFSDSDDDGLEFGSEWGSSDNDESHFKNDDNESPDKIESASSNTNKVNENTWDSPIKHQPKRNINSKVKTDSWEWDPEKSKRRRLKRILILTAIFIPVIVMVFFLINNVNSKQNFQKNLSIANEYYDQGKYEDAKIYFKDAMKYKSLPKSEMDKLTITENLISGIELFNSGQYESLYSNFQKTAKLGSPTAYFYLGELKYNGWDTDENLDKATEYYEKALSLGYQNADVYNKLGDIFSKEMGVDNNYKKALDYYLRSIELDNDFSVNYIKIGDLYSKGGFGVNKDEEEYIKYYELAVKYGHNEVVNKLGEVFNSKGSKAYYAKDYKTAREYFNKALKYGNNQVKDNIDFMDRNGL